jgi:hypothetical protein
MAEPSIDERVDSSPELRRCQPLARRMSSTLGRVEIGGLAVGQTAKPGVGYLALRTGATMVPVACSGIADDTRVGRARGLTAGTRATEHARD